jgi:hypothetical protein
MPLSRVRKIRARRSHRSASGQQTEGLSNVSGSNLVYAGYPYDPYAQAVVPAAAIIHG